MGLAHPLPEQPNHVGHSKSNWVANTLAEVLSIWAPLHRQVRPPRELALSAPSGSIGFLECQRRCSEDPRCMSFSWAPKIRADSVSIYNRMVPSHRICSRYYCWSQYDASQTERGTSGYSLESCRTCGNGLSSAHWRLWLQPQGEVTYRKVAQSRSNQLMMPNWATTLYQTTVSVRRRSEPRRRRSCVSCQLKVKKSSGEDVLVSDLKVGDMIEGMAGQESASTWCRVIFANQTGFGPLRGNFTESHWLINEEQGEMEANVSNSSTSLGELCGVATDCPAVREQNGSLFTPYSREFCNSSLSWNELVKLHAIILKVTSETGSFWFDPRNYHHNATNDLAPDWWMDQLPHLCNAILDCGAALNPSPACEEFDRRFKALVTSNLEEGFRLAVLKAFPDMHVARVVDDLERNILLLVGLGCLGLIILASLAVVCVARPALRQRTRKCCICRQPKQEKPVVKTMWTDIVSNEPKLQGQGEA